MKRKFLFVLAAGLIGALSLSTLGCNEMCCNSSQGGGSITITDAEANSSHKATFSYRVECIGTYDPNVERKVTGRLEYQDHKPWKKLGVSKTESVSIHGEVADVANAGALKDAAFGLVDSRGWPAPEYRVAARQDKFCAQNQNVAVFTGTYTPQPNPLGDAGKGTFVVAVQDNGKPGPSPEDAFVMKLVGGAFDGYVQKGVLAGGNIKQL